MRTLLRTLPAALLALALVSCASTGIVPEEHSMPAARASLKPEFRLFYDALQDYGDWVLIEPWGYVFRPRVNFDDWRPFGQGMWVPTDLYGWVWVSSEPYGWATYHYGDWLFDAYQGWVWQPGLDWSPAQVVWQTSDNYVGWAPHMPDQSQYAKVPGGAFSYVQVKDLAAPDLAAHVIKNADLDQIESQRIQPVENLDRREGVTFNRGPRIDWVEHFSGMLRRAQVQDLVPAAPAINSGADRDRTLDNDWGVTAKRAGLKAVAETEAAAARGSSPTRVAIVRPFGGPKKSSAQVWGPATRKAKVSEPDSSR